VFEVLKAYESAVGRALPWVAAPRRPGDLAAYWADPARAEAVLGFRARRSLADICTSSWSFARPRG
jgi:UDP-glucose 4-epimerase